MKIVFKRLAALALFAIPFAGMAQGNAAPEHASYFSNALFNILLALVIILLAVIAALGQALQNIAGSEWMLAKYSKEKDNDKGGGAAKITALAVFIFSALSASAQTPGSADKWMIGGLDLFTFFFMLAILLCEGIVIYILYRSIMGLIKSDSPVTMAVPEKKKSVLEKINASVDIGQEQDILLEHDYDGIRELDNNLPPWWKYGFYVTIVFACVYLVHYHVSRTGDLQKTEYEKSLAQAKSEIEAYMKSVASNVDETNVKLLGEADIASGKDIFAANCAACHGKEGQGGVGPNLTDAYWLHSGSIADIFKSIKYGWVDKGMKSWKEDLSPTQIAQVTSFIYSIRGTNPAGAKAPQGDLYSPEPLVTDSAIVKNDSLPLKRDTLKQ